MSTRDLSECSPDFCVSVGSRRRSAAVRISQALQRTITVREYYRDRSLHARNENIPGRERSELRVLRHAERFPLRSIFRRPVILSLGRRIPGPLAVLPPTANHRASTQVRWVRSRKTDPLETEVTYGVPASPHGIIAQREAKLLEAVRQAAGGQA